MRKFDGTGADKPILAATPTNHPKKAIFAILQAGSDFKDVALQ